MVQMMVALSMAILEWPESWTLGHGQGLGMLTWWFIDDPFLSHGY